MNLEIPNIDLLDPDQLVALIANLTTHLDKTTRYERARESLTAFAEIFSPGYELPPHIQKMIEVLEQIERGEIRRLVISCPPRSGKTMLLQLFEAWYFGKHPKRQIIHASYGADLAEDTGEMVRNFFMDDEWPEVFPQAKLSSASRSKKKLSTTLGGKYNAVGMGGVVTGRGAHVFILDDPLKDAQDADSVVVKKNNINWYQAVANSRLMSEGRYKGAVIICATRWSEDDLTGWALSEEGAKHEKWTVLSMPAVAEEEDPRRDPLHRKQGEPLWPERFPLDRLEEIKRTSGPRHWNSLYQQRPSAIEGNIIKREWWQEWTKPELPKFDLKICGIDTAYTEKKENDCSAFVNVGLFRDENGISNVLVTSTYNTRAEFNKLIADATEICNEFEPHVIMCENKASGISLYQELKRFGLPVVPYTPDREKRARVYSISPIFETKRIWYRNTPGNLELIEQMSTFPNAKHDDMVDALVMALLRVRSMNLVSPNPLDDGTSQARPFTSKRRKRGYW